MHLASATASRDHDPEIISIEDATETRKVLEGFYILKAISWQATGLYSGSLPESVSDKDQWFLTIMSSFLRREFTAANLVCYRIWQRKQYLFAHEEYCHIYRDKLQDMSRSQAKDSATREYIQHIVQNINTHGSFMTPEHAAHVARKMLRTASRWTALFNACKSIEIILLDQERRFDIKSIGEIIEQGTDEEFESWKEAILSPEVHLKEDCMCLSGVVRMIQNLAESNVHSDVRRVLADEVKARFEIWGGNPEGSDRTGREEPILSIPEILQEHWVNQIFGIISGNPVTDPVEASETGSQKDVSGEASNHHSSIQPDSGLDDLFEFDPSMDLGDGFL